MTPVAWMSKGGDVTRSKDYFEEMGFKDLIPLYTAPRELSDEEILELTKDSTIFEYREFDDDMIRFAKAILKKASEPNTYKPKVVDMVLRTDNQGNVLPQKEIKESE
jgi:hypothetical protein